jgi:hypothetical protein
MQIETRISKPKATKQLFSHFRADVGLKTQEALEIADKLVSFFATRAKKNTRQTAPELPADIQSFIDDGSILIDGYTDAPCEVIAVDEAMSDGGWMIMSEEKDFTQAVSNEGVYDDDYEENFDILGMEEIW